MKLCWRERETYEVNDPRLVISTRVRHDIRMVGLFAGTDETDSRESPVEAWTVTGWEGMEGKSCLA